jgi:riboflavin kinase/FMN adenylyltransferase
MYSYTPSLSRGKINVFFEDCQESEVPFLPMEVIHGIDKIKRKFNNPVITIGNFDGVHIGHLSLFQRVKDLAETMGGESIIITFYPHPIKVLFPSNGPPLITTHEQKVHLIEEAGIDVFVVIEFTPEFATMTASDFVQEIIHAKIGARAVVVGPDYRFGYKREGDIPALTRMGQELNFEVHVVPDITLNGVEISSSTIREFVIGGDLKRAREMLGRDYQVAGKVVRGRDRGGRLLGFPTANLQLIDELTPKPGVYATEVVIEGQLYDGATNIGYSPTFENGAFSVETHILDFSEDIYGKIIQVRFIERLRDEKTFSGPEELSQQIRKDVERAKKILAKRRTKSLGTN